MTPDPKPAPRVRDAALLRRLHRELTECEVTGYRWPLSLHHVSKHPRDDVRGNLVMVEGSGTTGFHGRLEARDPVALHMLGEYLVAERPDTFEYLRWRMGETAPAWVKRNLLVGWSL